MLTIIAAAARNNAIGNNNRLLWHLPEDLKRFKEITTGHTIIMGRKTFESLPGLLPDRYHIVITRNESFNVEDERVTVAHSIEEVLCSLKDEEEYFIIGGGEIYSQFLPYAEKIYLTAVDEEFQADTFFPDIDYTKWKVAEKIECTQKDKNSLPHTFITLNRV